MGLRDKTTPTSTTPLIKANISLLFFNRFCPSLICSSAFPCFPFFSFCYSFPIPFLPPHSFSSIIFSFLCPFFPLYFSYPFCCFSFLSFLPSFYSPGFFLLFPSSPFLVVFSFLPFNFFSFPSFLFISPF